MSFADIAGGIAPFVPFIVVSASAVAASVIPPATGPGPKRFILDVLNAAAFNFGYAKNKEPEPVKIAVSHLLAGVDELEARLPEIKKLAAEKFANTHDDLIVVKEFATDLAPKLGIASSVEKAADAALFLSRFGLI